MSAALKSAGIALIGPQNRVSSALGLSGASICGNDPVEGLEQCDGDTIPITCHDGTLVCDADCNLEAPMLDDIDEMEGIGSTDNVNLLVLLDRTPQHDKRDGNWSNSRLLFVTRDNTNGKIKSEVLENLKEMEETGVALDVPFLAAMSERLGVEMHRLEGEAHEAAGSFPSGHTTTPLLSLPLGVDARVVTEGVARLVLDESAAA